MILLLGGTAETAPLAAALADAGFEVLVSTVTDLPLELGHHGKVTRRIGPLDEQAMLLLARDRGVRAIVDATHPYAEAAHANARKVAATLDLPCLRWRRPEVIEPAADLHFAANHEEAATLACSLGGSILLTTGSTHLRPYVKACSRTGSALFVRVLDHPESVKAALTAGIPEANIVRGRGPFSVEENLAVITNFKIGVLVTKDSGEAGGVPAKLEAARIAGCRVVVIRRPDESCEHCYEELSEMVRAVRSAVDDTEP
ncbi:MAG: precorrin-6A reductase [Desulfomonile tiedjei]|nr:precorrin-6A reductase [Desulfomonile tiedjei]